MSHRGINFVNLSVGMSFRHPNMNGRVKLTPVENVTTYNPNTLLTFLLF